MVLVRNRYSLVSAGTEGSTVKTARKGFIGKAKERPQQVKQVLDVLKTQGVTSTYRTVTKKLESLSPLGYSCVGDVVEVGAGVDRIRVGSIVACGGNSASHAEFVAVPEMLCIEVPIEKGGDEDQQLKAAAYNTLGAIAMQGVRQADLKLGERCAVIGLGLLGQITVQLLRASGVIVVGTDVVQSAVDVATQLGADLAVVSSHSSAVAEIDQFTAGTGVDAVIITAATSSTDPINFAGQIARHKGRVVIVGDVATGFDRNPYYYEKELELRMSCSYGPGRYDTSYEEKGLDYPFGYVRWTENRNMAAFQELIARGQLDLAALTTHEFSLADAPNAYEMILGKTEPYLGILIRYDSDATERTSRVDVRPRAPADAVNLAMVGAGNYAQGYLLPNLPSPKSGVCRRIVMTNSGTTSRGVAERFDFESCTSNSDDVFDDSDINAVIVSTRHDSHAEYVVRSIAGGKAVLVDKPLCITPKQLDDVQSAIAESSEPPVVMVGYNRRFSPLASDLQSKLGNGPKAMLYRVNAGRIPLAHWTQDAEIGGGRVVGEVCHFIDFMVFVCGALPTSVSAVAMPDDQGNNDTIHINLSFADGSTGTVLYLANGAKSVAKEYVEVFGNGQTAVLTDFRSLEIHGGGRPAKTKLASQNKGQAEMLQQFFGVIRDGGSSPIPVDQQVAVSRATFAVLESLRKSQTIRL